MGMKPRKKKSKTWTAEGYVWYRQKLEETLYWVNLKRITEGNWSGMAPSDADLIDGGGLPVRRRITITVEDL